MLYFYSREALHHKRTQTAKDCRESPLLTVLGPLVVVQKRLIQLYHCRFLLQQNRKPKAEPLSWIE